MSLLFLTPDLTHEWNVPWKNGSTLCVDRAEDGILIESDHVSLGRKLDHLCSLA